MKPSKIICAVILVFLLGFVDYSNAAFGGNGALPDVGDAQITVGHCDDGRTIVTSYSKVNEWFLATVERSGWTLAVYSLSPNWPIYFIASPGEALHEISRGQYMDKLARISPNRFRQMRREPNDCPKFN